jgi:hypothetical protein
MSRHGWRITHLNSFARTKFTDVRCCKFRERLRLAMQLVQAIAQCCATGEFGVAVASGLAGADVNMKEVQMGGQRLSGNERGLRDDLIAIAATDKREN